MKGLGKGKISIITNYGCKLCCSYCIWRNHRFKDRKTTINNFDFEKLRNFIITNRNKLEDHISISGGGDPLFNADVTNSTANLFLKKIIKIKKEFGLKLQIHTREFEVLKKLDEEVFTELDKIVLSYDDFIYERIEEKIEYLLNRGRKLRIGKVLTEYDFIKEYNIDRDIQCALHKNIQLTFYPDEKKLNKKFLEYMNKYLSYEKSGLKFLVGSNFNYYWIDNNIYDDFAGYIKIY